MELRYIALLPIVITSFQFYSCQNENHFLSITEHEYSEVSNKIIDFDACFEINEEDYYVYIFSPFCGHCRRIQNPVIEFALSELFPIYFVYYTEEIKVVNDVTSTIGVSSISGLAILGVPTLIYIEDKIVKLNIAGADKILTIIEPYLTDNLLNN